MNFQPSVLDLFTGCGGFSLGFEQAGFETKCAIEKWHPAVETFRKNFPGTCILEGDIQVLKYELLKLYKPGDFDVIIGGPPCQGFSMSGDRNVFDPRGQLYRDFLDVVYWLKPVVFVMENVKGLLTMKHVPYWKYSRTKRRKFVFVARKIQRYKYLSRVQSQRNLTNEEKNELLVITSKITYYQSFFERHLLSILDKLIPNLMKILERKYNVKYIMSYGVLNAANYGVPQKRERVILIGTRGDINFPYKLFPMETHQNSGQQQVTMDKFLPGNNRKLQYWTTVRDAIHDLIDTPEDELFHHIMANHSPGMIKKLGSTRPGTSVYKNFTEGWYRLKWNEPTPTLHECHGGHFVHPEKNRTLTPRELARLQSFPDSFTFVGKKTHVEKMIGNAVPPELARQIAR